MKSFRNYLVTGLVMAIVMLFGWNFLPDLDTQLGIQIAAGNAVVAGLWLFLSNGARRKNDRVLEHILLLMAAGSTGVALGLYAAMSIFPR